MSSYIRSCQRPLQVRLFTFAASTLLLALAPPARGDSPAGSLPAIVFVSRDLTEAPTRVTPTVVRSRRGRLLVRETDGSIGTLVDARGQQIVEGVPVDVMDPDGSFDGSRVVFSGLSAVEGSFRIYEIDIDGNGLRQITRSAPQEDLSRYGEAAGKLRSHDDLDPCYLPDGRICFVSTRYPEISPDGRVRSTNLYVVNRDGSGLHRITTERFGADTPVVEPATGRIVYSRWWRTVGSRPIPPGSTGYSSPGGNSDPRMPPEDRTTSVVDPRVVLGGIEASEFTGVNGWFLSGINPDGTDLSAWSLFRLDREQTQAYRPSFLPDGRALALFIPQTPILGSPGRNGLRRLSRGAAKPEALGGPQTFGEASLPESWVYGSAAALPDGRFLVSARKVAPDYDLFVAGAGGLIPLHGAPGSSELDGTPVMAREIPPIIEDRVTGRLPEVPPLDRAEAFRKGGTFTFLVENIHFNAPVDVPIPNAPPVGEGLSIEFFAAPQRTSEVGADNPILLERVSIGSRGRVMVDLPAGVPLFEVLRRPDGRIAVGRDGQVFHVGGMNFGQAGQTARCVGCHAGHSQMEVPRDSTWTNLAPSAVVTASSTLSTDGRSFKPEALVDRRTDGFESEWAAGPGASHVVELRWSVPIHARSLVLHPPRAEQGGSVREQVIWGFKAATYLRGRLQDERVFRQEIPSRSLSLRLDASLEFDALAITVPQGQVSGRFEGGTGPGLAEVEVIAQVRPSGMETVTLVRGDSNCDRDVDLSDAVAVLNSLFNGGGAVCCEAAGDANADGELTLSDAVIVLHHRFLAGPAPEAPFPGCGSVFAGGLSCDRQVCPN